LQGNRGSWPLREAPRSTADNPMTNKLGAAWFGSGATEATTATRPCNLVAHRCVRLEQLNYTTPVPAHLSTPNWGRLFADRLQMAPCLAFERAEDHKITWKSQES
jgi:hypothetical protein